MINYPIGVQDFEKIRTGGFVYVDKTDLVYKLTRGNIYFLGRPRRFGKSLLVSTLKYYFEGRRDLFEGLKIMDLEQEWTKHPVLLFDFNLSEHKAANGLRDYMLDVISKGEQEHGIAPLMTPTAAAPCSFPRAAWPTFWSRCTLRWVSRPWCSSTSTTSRCSTSLRRAVPATRRRWRPTARR